VAGLLSAAAQDQDIYTDSLQNSWQNWSWATVNLSATSPVHTGTKSAAVTAGAWEAIYLHHDAFDSSGYASVSFWIHGGAAGGQKIQLQGLLSGTAQTAVQIHPTTSWQQVTVTLASLGVANKPDLDGFWIQDSSGAAQPTFYIDDMKLIAGPPPPPPGPVTLTVDAAADRHPIDPRVYGMAFASQAQVADLNVSLNRSGGNSESRYNWQLNAHNRAMDWYFESLPDDSSTPGAAGDSFITGTKNGGAQPMITIPVLDWTPKLGPNRGRLASFSITKYGAQSDNDSQWFPDAGNGLHTDGSPITGNDPNDANAPATSAFQMDWVRHLTNRWGLSPNGGVRYYILDNEPSLWNSTHRDIHPIGETMGELRDKFYDYAPKIKDLDPGALIVGPEEWGWPGYFYSGADQAAGSANGWTKFPDREANGNQDYLPWFLDRMRERSATEGRRLLDVFTVHYYPQSGEYSTNISSSLQTLRNRSTRSLWDPNYTDASWIADKVRLIPRLREWANLHYPGTQIGITEYSWGADPYINGATAQADVLGIFGREGLDLATRWTTPVTGTPTYNAIKMYRNYDGAKSTFGQTSVRATAPNPDNVAIFAAERTDGALTVIAINKQLTTAAPAILNVTNFPATTSQRWQLTSANTITRLSDQPVTSNTISNTLPAQSITLFVFANTAAQLSSPTYDSSNLHMTLNGIAGKDYAIESTNDFVTWTRQQTNNAPAASFEVTLPRPSATRFFRAVQLN
jgi:hypothetical protein